MPGSEGSSMAFSSVALVLFSPNFCPKMSLKIHEISVPKVPPSGQDSWVRECLNSSWSRIEPRKGQT